MNQSILRITKELKEIQKSTDLSIAVASTDTDIRNVRATIIGPHETPYQNGFFEFEVKFPDEYPSKSPSVVATTTAGGTARFNPNIYADGKVCLSILGTWRGASNEQWSPAQGLESVLWSIQSLMSANPYENEPGYNNRADAATRVDQEAYVLKIRHETLRITIIRRLEGYLGLKPDSSSLIRPRFSPPSPDGDVPFPGSVPQVTYASTNLNKPKQLHEEARSRLLHSDCFKELYKKLFLWYYESYQNMVKVGIEAGKEGKPFKSMPFESVSNGLKGHFNFADLGNRLTKIKAALDLELASWKTVGAVAKSNQSSMAMSLQQQFDQMKSATTSANDVSLEAGNPFVWVLTYFGKPATKLEGAILRIKLHISPNFPKEPPRAICQNKIFHQFMTPDGLIAYTLPQSKEEEVRNHIQAIIELLENESPAYDPRQIVNPEASSLYWGKDADSRRKYHRRLRRSVEDSLEQSLE